MQVKAVKLGDKHAVSVLAAPYGGPHDRDSDGEYFTQWTKFHLDRYTPSPLYYHGYTKEKAQAAEPVFLGRTVKHEADSQGVWLTVELDTQVPEAMEVWNAARKGSAAASSGSIAHLVRKTGDGEITQWPMAEISLWERTSDRPQANKRAIALPALKAAGLDIPDELVEYCESADHAIEEPAQASSAGGDSSSYISTTTKDSTKMDYEDKDKTPDVDVKSLVNDAVKSALEQAAEVAEKKRKDEESKQAEIEEARKEEREKAEEAIKAAKEESDAKLKEAEETAAKANRLPMFGQAPYQAKFGYTRQYENIEEPTDLALAIDILGAHPKAGPVGEDAYKSLAHFIESSDDEEVKEHTIKAAGIKADELNQSTLAGFGGEWVSNAWSSTLWRRILLETPVVSKIPTMVIPQGAESVTIPLEGDPITFYRTPQAADQTANPGRPTPTVMTDKHQTLNNTITPTKITGATSYSAEITEDSIVMWASEIRRQMQQRAQEIMEHLVIDGDTSLAANTNINHIAGTPTARDLYTAFDGFRKLALVTNTANRRPAGGLVVEDYLNTVRLMGRAGRNARNKRSVSFITDMNTNWATHELVEVKNRDFMPQGANPTVSGGDVVSMWGYDVIPSAYMHDIDPDLRVDANGMVNQGAAGTVGSILAVRWDQWKLGYKRQWTLEVDKDIWSDSHVIVMHARLGMIARDAEAAAISVNVTN